MKYLYYSFLLVFAAQTAGAQNIDQLITRDYVDHLIKTLSADDMQGRATFSPGIDKAATFIETAFKQIGLKPLTGEKGYRQTFYKYQVKPASLKLTLNGQAVPEQEVFVMGSSAASLSFDQGSGDGWIRISPDKPFRAQLRQAMQNNKRQLILVDHQFSKEFAQFRAHAASGSVLDEKDIKPASQSALVFVLSQDTAANQYQVALTNTVAKLPLFNVAGMIPGKSRAKELVIFSGHYDHLGIIKQEAGQDSIANGADDDASGTTAVIALARYYQKLNKNERTLIFVAFTAEEIGGFGARHFSEQLNPEDVTAMFNIEMIGKESKFGKNTAFITGFEKSDFGAILQKNLQGSAFAFHPDPYPAQNLFYRSDNATLAALGVPAHTISTDQIDTDKLYHSVKDEYSTLDVDNILSTIKAIAKSATTIINGTDTPARIPKLKE